MTTISINKKKKLTSSSFICTFGFVYTISLAISRSKIFSYKMFFFSQYNNLIFKQLAAGVVIAEIYWNNPCSALIVHSWARLTF